MTQEEKAKRYDELLVKLQEAKADNNVCDERYCCVIDDIVPELAESEDEKIRKALINFLKSPFVNENITDEKVAPWIAWLEKQNSNVDNANKEYWKGYREGKQEILDKYAELEKQGEQKPDEVRTTGYWNVQDIEQKPTEEYNITGISSNKSQGKLGEIIKKLKTTWSEEDEKILGKCIDAASGYYSPEDKQSMKNWLKSLKDRVQPKQEWSEEDESILQGIWDEILANKHQAKEYEWKTYDKFLNWLKSLRPQNRWKPSEEQIKALDFAIDCTVYPEFNIQRSVLKELLEQLKKLREE